MKKMMRGRERREKTGEEGRGQKCEKTKISHFGGGAAKNARNPKYDTRLSKVCCT